MRTLLFFFFSAVSALMVACVPTTDLGVQCTLVKKNASGAVVPLTEGEIRANRDYISFGSTECEDQICVRDSSFRRPSNAVDSNDAVGYCSAQCVPTSSIGCVAAKESDNKDTSPNKLTCRALLLDAATLAYIKTNFPAAFKSQLGETTDPYFCARTAPEL